MKHKVDHIVLASQNKGKLLELQSMLEPLGITVTAASSHDLPPFPPEDGSSYRENAFIKAHHVHRHTGLASLGDDSGLEVAALAGAPGLYSARYGNRDSDQARNAYLLEQLAQALADNPAQQLEQARAARFVCGLALLLANGEEVYIEAYCQGEILTSPQGETGFGYDPLFFSHDLGKSFAEASKQEKAEVSHRGRALSELLGWLERE